MGELRHSTVSTLSSVTCSLFHPHRRQLLQRIWADYRSSYSGLVNRSADTSEVDTADWKAIIRKQPNLAPAVNQKWQRECVKRGGNSCGPWQSQILRRHITGVLRQGSWYRMLIDSSLLEYYMHGVQNASFESTFLGDILWEMTFWSVLKRVLGA